MSDTPSSLPTRASLLVRLRDGRDAESWSQFVRLYAPVIHRYCRSRGLQDADAADVTQDVLGQVARAMHSFEYQPEKGRFRDWLGTVTRHRLARFAASQARTVQGRGGDDGPELLANAIGPEVDNEWSAEFNAKVLRFALEQIRAHFEPATWRAFECVWIENLSAADTARELNQPIDAVYVAKSRVLKRLREEIMHLAEDMPHLVPLH